MKYFLFDVLDSYQVFKFLDLKKLFVLVINFVVSFWYVGVFDIDLEQFCFFKMYMFFYVGNGYVVEVRGDVINIWKVL